MSSTIIPGSAVSGKSIDAPIRLDASEAERLKAEQLEIDTVGLLVKFSPQESLKQAVQRGLFMWQVGPFHRNFTPTECRIHSAEAARWQIAVGATLLGLTVVVSDTVPESHARLCCVVAKG